MSNYPRIGSRISERRIGKGSPKEGMVESQAPQRARTRVSSTPPSLIATPVTARKDQHRKKHQGQLSRAEPPRASIIN